METKTELTPEQKKEADEALSKPAMGVDREGRFFLTIPLKTTSRIWARGLLDEGRTLLLAWYAEDEKHKRETGLVKPRRSIKDIILGKGA